MAYNNDKDGKEVTVVSEYVVYVHKCPKCGITFSVTHMYLEDEDEYEKDYWSSLSQTPNYCYMCGSVMGGDVLMGD
jgi:hypothetical protein